MMWRKFDKIKKRKLCESDDESDPQSTDLTYENRYFRDKDDSMNSSRMDTSSRMDISMHESNNLSNLRHLDESDVKVKKSKRTPSKKSKKTPSKTPSKTSSKNKSAKKKEDDETSDSESSSEEECMVDSSDSSADERLIRTPKKSRTPLAEKKIKKREKFLKKQLDKLNKKDKKDKKKSKKKKSKKHKS